MLARLQSESAKRDHFSGRKAMHVLAFFIVLFLIFKDKFRHVMHIFALLSKYDNQCSPLIPILILLTQHFLLHIDGQLDAAPTAAGRRA